jgi:hypothetical protein
MSGYKAETPNITKTYTVGSVDCTTCFDQGRLNSIIAPDKAVHLGPYLHNHSQE